MWVQAGALDVLAKVVRPGLLERDAADAARGESIAPVSRPPLLLHAYPNSGEVYVDKQWVQDSGASDESLAALAVDWVANHGAKLVGGCCRTTPETIRAIRRALVPE
jgi:S-methylmethionine-dependent homocysteine/selenocysteine methylase